jgi:hypothetical protein
MEYVLVFEMFQRFSNTQTYVNKQTISWWKETFCDDMCFWSFLWSWQKDVNMRLRICFVSRKWHVNKKHRNMLLVCVR